MKVRQALRRHTVPQPPACVPSCFSAHELKAGLHLTLSFFGGEQLAPLVPRIGSVPPPLARLIRLGLMGVALIGCRSVLSKLH